MKKCNYCDKEFKPKGSQKYCSIFCRLRFNSMDNSQGCWESTLFRDNQGYTRTNINDKIITSSRLMFKEFFEIDPSYYCVCHTCDNPSCINPMHLFLGTNKDNMQDCLKKGRLADKKGTKNPFHKLKDNEVSEIKKLIQEKMDIDEISNKFNVSKDTIYLIRKGKIWKHIGI